MFNRTTNVSAQAARRPHVPRALPLPQVYRRTGTSPQSPLKENIVFGQTLATVTSPSAFFGPVSPRPASPNFVRMRLETLAHCLQSSVPAEIVWPSFGQAGEETKRVSTFLDLYRIRAQDDAHLRKVRSPTSRDGEGEWAAFEDIAESVAVRKDRFIRRSRSLGEIKGDIAGPADMPNSVARATQDCIAQGPRIVVDTSPRNDLAIRRKKSLENAKNTIVSSDAQRMAEFRRRFGARSRQLHLAPLPPPDAPLPSPPLSSSLLKVKSPLPLTVAPRRMLRPRMISPIVTSPGGDQYALKSPQAPYWVKARATPRTPRTMRSERRQGWGGLWDQAALGQVVEQLKEEN